MYVVNVCVALRRRDQWLLIVRHPDLGHAGGTLAVPGGKVEATTGPSGDDVLEATARREIAEGSASISQASRSTTPRAPSSSPTPATPS